MNENLDVYIQSIFDYLNANGIFTGSRAYGIAEHGSDYDYALNDSNYQFFLSNVLDGNIIGQSIKPSTYEVGSYITVKDSLFNTKTFNVFCIDFERLETWKETTKILKGIAENPNLCHLVKDKAFRVMMFRSIEAQLYFGYQIIKQKTNDQIISNDISNFANI